MGWAGGGGGGGGGGGRSWEDEINHQINQHRTSREKSYKKYENAMSTHKGTTDNLDKFGLRYDPQEKKWIERKEKTNHKTDMEIHNEDGVEEKNWIEYKYGYMPQRWGGVVYDMNIDFSPIQSGNNTPNYSESHRRYREGRYNVDEFRGWIEVDTNTSDPSSILNTVVNELNNKRSRHGDKVKQTLQSDVTGSDDYWKGTDQNSQIGKDIQSSRIRKGKVNIDNEINKKWNKISRDINDSNRDLNNKNEAKNQAYQKIIDVSNRTQGTDFIDRRNNIEDDGFEILNNAGFTDEQIKKLAEQGNEQFKSFYRTEKLKKWDTNLAAPIPGPSGSQFDGEYYLGESQAATETWNQAVEDDDIDITERYDNDSNVFALQHWTNQGRQAGLRAYAPALAEAVENYAEITTDDDIQKARDKQLGISDMDTYRTNILNIPYIGQEWEKASSEEGDEYWKELGDEYNLDEKDADEFIALFKLSEREADRDVSFLHQINNPGYGGISELEDAITEAAGDKARVDIQKFGALTKDVLKQTIAEIKEAKSKESFLGTIQNFAGYGEIMDVNKSLSNSLLGDLDTGGYLSWMGGEETKDKLEKEMERITGVKNNITYNWQKWYDDELKTQYESGGTFYTGEDDPETIEDERKKYEIDAEFGKAFIDEYLTKRFDQSKSMNEFVEYLDVRDTERNPFQTMDMLDALNLRAEMEAQKWQDEQNLKLDNGERSESFDSNFYLNPSAGEENIGKITKYAEQTEKIQQDLETAKNNPDQLIDENLPALGTWKQQLYKYGVNLEDDRELENGLTTAENNFAKMHFDVVGQSKGFDAAEDFLNPSKIRSYVYENILPNLEDEALEQGTVFGEFVTPEEFADDMLEGVDPDIPDSWQEVLNSMEDTGQIEDADNWQGTYEDLKEMIMEVMRTGSASEIRSNIKYLNENRKRPTQERLGALYIERESDYQPKEIEGETELFKTFQKAGFEGSEEDFYDDFFPDLNREDQKLLTIAGEDKKIGSFMDADFSDPFASFSQISEFLVDDDKTKEEKEENKKQGTSFFSLDDEDDNDWDYKKKKTESTFGSLSNLFS